MNNAHMAEIDGIYRAIENPVALRLAPQLERFYKWTNGARKHYDERDCDAAIGALKFVAALDDYFGILETQATEPYKESRRFYCSQDLITQRSPYPLISVACFPGPSPQFTRGKVPNDDLEQHRILLKGKNQKGQAVRTSIPLINSDIEGLVRNFSFLL